MLELLLCSISHMSHISDARAVKMEGPWDFYPCPKQSSWLHLYQTLCAFLLLKVPWHNIISSPPEKGGLWMPEIPLLHLAISVPNTQNCLFQWLCCWLAWQNNENFLLQMAFVSNCWCLYNFAYLSIIFAIFSNFILTYDMANCSPDVKEPWGITLLLLLLLLIMTMSKMKKSRLLFYFSGEFGKTVSYIIPVRSITPFLSLLFGLLGSGFGSHKIFQGQIES